MTPPFSLEEKPKWTPGPWEWRSSPFGHGLQFLIGQPATGQRHTIARAMSVSDHPGEQESNANLIVAAPDLYEALTHALGIIVEFGDLNGFRNLNDSELGATIIAVSKEAARALTKARGDA